MPKFQFPVRRRETDIRITIAPIAPIVHASDTSPLITDVAKGPGDTNRMISRKGKATAAAPNTTRSPTNEDLIAMEAAMKIVNMSPKISTGSRSSGTYLPICRVVRDSGKAAYMHQTRAANSAARLCDSNLMCEDFAGNVGEEALQLCTAIVLRDSYSVEC